MKKNKGFTLTELLAVIVIIAILSVAAISGYSTMTRNSKKKTYESKVGEIENAALKFAKDANLSSSTTISVNKLVVEGYLQPDESTETGLASILNPVNNENMICNLIRITINDDVFIAEYDDSNKDCLIAEQEMLDLDINISAKELTGSTIGSNINIVNNVANWTRKDVLLIVSSEKYTDFKSVSYDFDGKTITKDKNTPVSSATNYVDTDYDKIAIKDVLIMFNSGVTVTYNMNDGTTHSRTVVVRIDKEIPTAKVAVSNDVSTSSTRKVNLYLDDANGSGIKGFYISKNNDFTSRPLIKDETDKNSKEAGHGSFAGYKSHFYGEQGAYYIKVIDKVGNEYITEKIELSNFDPNANSCKITVTPLTGATPTYWTEDTEWYNKNIKVTTTSNNDIGSMGLKYFYDVVNVGTNITNEKKLTKFFRPEGTNTKLIKSINQTNESDLRDYYTAMKGLSDKTKNITHCKKTIGVDKTKPAATISCTDCNTYKKTHTINISITDELSGFSDRSIKIGWSPNRTTAPTSWLDLNGTISADKKTVSFTTNANKTTGTALTGEYYLWIQGESIADKAYNYLNNTPTTYVIKYDNTPPACVSSGGNPNWRNIDLTLTGTCSDSHSLCKKATITKKYSSDINSNVESPGRVYDNADNYTDCPANQHVHIDKTKPTCTNGGGNSNWVNTSISITGTCSDSLSGCTGNVSRTYNYEIDSSTETPGTVYDNAGNSRACASNRHVHIDKTAPRINSLSYQYRASMFRANDDSVCQVIPNSKCKFTLDSTNKVYQLTSGSKKDCISSIRWQLKNGCGKAEYNSGTLSKSAATNYITNLVSVNNGGAEIKINSVSASDNKTSSPTITIKYGGFNPDASSQTANSSYTLGTISGVNSTNHGRVYVITARDAAGNTSSWTVIASHYGSNDVRANTTGPSQALQSFNKFIRIGETKFRQGWQQRYYLRTYYMHDDHDDDDITYIPFWTYYSDANHKIWYNGTDMCPDKGCQLHGFYYIGSKWYWFNTNEVNTQVIANGGMVASGHGFNGRDVCKSYADYMADGDCDNGKIELRVDSGGVCSNHP